MRLLPSVLVSLASVVALSACTAEPSPAPASPAPTVTVTVTATAPAPSPTSSEPLTNVAIFRSESTTCEFDTEGSETPGVGCQMYAEYTYDIPDAWLEYGIECSTISLGYEDAEGYLGCASDVSFPDAAMTAPLAPGTAVSHGGIVCTLLAVGVTCTNEVGGVATITPEGYVAATD